MLLLSCYKHTIRFRNMWGEFVAFQSSIQLNEIVIYSIIKVVYVRSLVAQTRFISIDGYCRVLNSMQQIIYIRKRRGPKQEPVGTLTSIFSILELIPLTLQNNLRLSK